MLYRQNSVKINSNNSAKLILQKKKKKKKKKKKNTKKNTQKNTQKTHKKNRYHFCTSVI